MRTEVCRHCQTPVAYGVEETVTYLALDGGIVHQDCFPAFVEARRQAEADAERWEQEDE